MKISLGPKLKQYAAIKDIPEEEVLEWVTAYVNTPDQFHNAELIEKNENERFTSIGAYITREIENSTTGRIRRSIAQDRRLAA